MRGLTFHLREAAAAAGGGAPPQPAPAPAGEGEGEGQQADIPTFRRPGSGDGGRAAGAARAAALTLARPFLLPAVKAAAVLLPHAPTHILGTSLVSPGGGRVDAPAVTLTWASSPPVEEARRGGGDGEGGSAAPPSRPAGSAGAAARVLGLTLVVDPITATLPANGGASPAAPVLRLGATSLTASLAAFSGSAARARGSSSGAGSLHILEAALRVGELTVAADPLGQVVEAFKAGTGGGRAKDNRATDNRPRASARAAAATPAPRRVPTPVTTPRPLASLLPWLPDSLTLRLPFISLGYGVGGGESGGTFTLRAVCLDAGRAGSAAAATAAASSATATSPAAYHLAASFGGLDARVGGAPSAPSPPALELSADGWALTCAAARPDPASLSAPLRLDLDASVGGCTLAACPVAGWAAAAAVVAALPPPAPVPARAAVAVPLPLAPPPPPPASPLAARPPAFTLAARAALAHPITCTLLGRDGRPLFGLTLGGASGEVASGEGGRGELTGLEVSVGPPAAGTPPLCALPKVSLTQESGSLVPILSLAGVRVQADAGALAVAGASAAADAAPPAWWRARVVAATTRPKPKKGASAVRAGLPLALDLANLEVRLTGDASGDGCARLEEEEDAKENEAPPRPYGLDRPPASVSSASFVLALARVAACPPEASSDATAHCIALSGLRISYEETLSAAGGQQEGEAGSGSARVVALLDLPTLTLSGQTGGDARPSIAIAVPAGLAARFDAGAMLGGAAMAAAAARAAARAVSAVPAAGGGEGEEARGEAPPPATPNPRRPAPPKPLPPIIALEVEGCLRLDTDMGCGAGGWWTEVAGGVGARLMPRPGGAPALALRARGVAAGLGPFNLVTLGAVGLDDVTTAPGDGGSDGNPDPAAAATSAALAAADAVAVPHLPALPWADAPARAAALAKVAGSLAPDLATPPPRTALSLRVAALRLGLPHGCDFGTAQRHAELWGKGLGVAVGEHEAAIKEAVGVVRAALGKGRAASQKQKPDPSAAPAWSKLIEIRLALADAVLEFEHAPLEAALATALPAGAAAAAARALWARAVDASEGSGCAPSPSSLTTAGPLGAAATGGAAERAALASSLASAHIAACRGAATDTVAAARSRAAMRVEVEAGSVLVRVGGHAASATPPAAGPAGAGAATAALACPSTPPLARALAFIVVADPAYSGGVPQVGLSALAVHAALVGVQAFFCGCPAPLAHAPALGIAGPLVIARQATAPPVTRPRSIPLGPWRRVTLGAAGLKGTRAVPKAFAEEVVITCPDGLSALFGPGLDPTIVLVAQAGKRLSPSDPDKALPKPTNLPWWDMLRLNVRGRVRLAVGSGGGEGAAGAGAPSSSAPSHPPSGLVFDLARDSHPAICGGAERLRYTAHTLTLTTGPGPGMVLDFAHLRAVGLGALPAAGPAAASGAPPGALGSHHIASFPRCVMTVGFGWVLPGGRDPGDPYPFPKDGGMGAAASRSLQAPVDLGAMCAASTLDTSLSFDLRPGPGGGTGGDPAPLLPTLTLGGAQVVFLKGLFDTLKAAPPWLRLVAKRGTFFARLDPLRPPGVSLPKLLRRMEIEVASPEGLVIAHEPPPAAPGEGGGGMRPGASWGEVRVAGGLSAPVVAPQPPPPPPALHPHLPPAAAPVPGVYLLASTARYRGSFRLNLPAGRELAPGASALAVKKEAARTETVTLVTDLVATDVQLHAGAAVGAASLGARGAGGPPLGEPVVAVPVMTVIQTRPDPSSSAPGEDGKKAAASTASPLPALPRAPLAVGLARARVCGGAPERAAIIAMAGDVVASFRAPAWPRTPAPPPAPPPGVRPPSAAATVAGWASRPALLPGAAATAALSPLQTASAASIPDGGALLRQLLQERAAAAGEVEVGDGGGGSGRPRAGAGPRSPAPPVSGGRAGSPAAAASPARGSSVAGSGVGAPPTTSLPPPDPATLRYTVCFDGLQACLCAESAPGRVLLVATSARLAGGAPPGAPRRSALAFDAGGVSAYVCLTDTDPQGPPAWLDDDGGDGKGAAALPPPPPTAATLPPALDPAALLRAATAAAASTTITAGAAPVRIVDPFTLAVRKAGAVDPDPADPVPSTANGAADQLALDLPPITVRSDATAFSVAVDVAAGSGGGEWGTAVAGGVGADDAALAATPEAADPAVGAARAALWSALQAATALRGDVAAATAAVGRAESMLALPGRGRAGAGGGGEAVAGTAAWAPPDSAAADAVAALRDHLAAAVVVAETEAAAPLGAGAALLATSLPASATAAAAAHLLPPALHQWAVAAGRARRAAVSGARADLASARARARAAAPTRHARHTRLTLVRVAWSLLEADGAHFLEAALADVTLAAEANPDHSGGSKLVIRGLEVREDPAHPRLPPAPGVREPGGVLVPWNPDASWEAEPALRVLARRAPAAPGFSAVYEHIEATLHPLGVHLSDSVAGGLWDYFFPPGPDDGPTKRQERFLAKARGGGEKDKERAAAAALLLGSRGGGRRGGSGPASDGVASPPTALSDDDGEVAVTPAPPTGGRSALAAGWAGVRRSGATAAAAAVQPPTTTPTPAAPLPPPGRPPAHRILFEHVRLNRVHCRVSYAGYPLSFSDLKLLLDGRTYECVDGSWRDLASRLKWDTVKSVLKSVAGLQGRKFKELLAAEAAAEAAAGGGDSDDDTRSERGGGNGGGVRGWLAALVKRADRADPASEEAEGGSGSGDEAAAAAAAAVREDDAKRRLLLGAAAVGAGRAAAAATAEAALPPPAPAVEQSPSPPPPAVAPAVALPPSFGASSVEEEAVPLVVVAPPPAPPPARPPPPPPLAIVVPPPSAAAADDAAVYSPFSTARLSSPASSPRAGAGAAARPVWPAATTTTPAAPSAASGEAVWSPMGTGARGGAAAATPAAPVPVGVGGLSLASLLQTARGASEEGGGAPCSDEEGRGVAAAVALGVRPPEEPEAAAAPIPPPPADAHTSSHPHQSKAAALLARAKAAASAAEAKAKAQAAVAKAKLSERAGELRSELKDRAGELRARALKKKDGGAGVGGSGSEGGTPRGSEL